MPKEPPSTGWIRKGGVIGVFAEEMTVVAAVSRTGKRSRVRKRSSSNQRDRNNRVVLGKTGIAASAGMEATEGGKEAALKEKSHDQEDR